MVLLATPILHASAAALYSNPWWLLSNTFAIASLILSLTNSIMVAVYQPIPVGEIFGLVENSLLVSLELGRSLIVGFFDVTYNLEWSLAMAIPDIGQIYNAVYGLYMNISAIAMGGATTPLDWVDSATAISMVISSTFLRIYATP